MALGSNLQQPVAAPGATPTIPQQVQQGFSGATGTPSLIQILAQLGLVTQPPKPQQSKK